MKRNVWIAVLAAGLMLILWVGGVWAMAADEPVPAAAWRDSVVLGTVATAAGDEITVETGEGEVVALLVGERTRLWRPGAPPTTTVSLAAGEPVLALGRPAAAGEGRRVLEARLILVAGKEDLPRYLAQGQVVAVTRQTVVIKAQRGERALTVVPHTRFWSPGGQGALLQDLRSGDRLLAIGQPTDLGQWIAGAIVVAGGEEQAPRRAGVKGEIVAIDLAGGSLTVRSPRGEVTVVVDDETRYRLPGIAAPGLSDLQVGDLVGIVGSYDRQAGHWVARVIALAAGDR